MEMYTADLDRPWGAGSWVASKSVRSNWVLPAPLDVVSEGTWQVGVYETRGLVPFASHLDQVARADATAQGLVELGIQGAYRGDSRLWGGSMAGCRQEGGWWSFLCAEADMPMQLRDEVGDQLAQLGGGYLGALRYMGGVERDEVVCRDEGLVERRQQMGEPGGVEVGQHVQQVRHVILLCALSARSSGSAEERRARTRRGVASWR